jgi:hypothetical protein
MEIASQSELEVLGIKRLRSGAIHISSKLVDAIKVHAPDGDRFAIAQSAMTVLPPNQEGRFGLNSVNSCDSLSSCRYQELMENCSAVGTRTYRKHFRFLDIRRALADQTFPFSNVRLILSRHPLAADQLTLVAEANRIKTYKPVTAAVDVLQTPRFHFSNAGEATIDLSASPPTQSYRVEILNDCQKIDVTVSPEETLLFLSQQYHRAWWAGSRNRSLRAAIVNPFCQGVVLPLNTSGVELSFRPFVLWRWLPQLLFAASAALLLLRSALQMGRRQCAVRLSSAGSSQPA